MAEFAKGGTVCGKNVIMGDNVVETIIPNKKPTIKGLEDIVNVVRCKDCKYYREGAIFKDIKFCFRLRGDNDKPVGYNFSEDDFCSRGERREGE